MKDVYVEGLGWVGFPDEMADEDISKVLVKRRNQIETGMRTGPRQEDIQATLPKAMQAEPVDTPFERFMAKQRELTEQQTKPHLSFEWAKLPSVKDVPPDESEKAVLGSIPGVNVLSKMYPEPTTQAWRTLVNTIPEVGEFLTSDVGLETMGAGLGAKLGLLPRGTGTAIGTAFFVDMFQGTLQQAGYTMDAWDKMNLNEKVEALTNVAKSGAMTALLGHGIKTELKGAAARRQFEKYVAEVERKRKENASQKREAETVLPTVPPQPGQGEGQVPTTPGGGGVPGTQAEEGKIPLGEKKPPPIPKRDPKTIELSFDEATWGGSQAIENIMEDHGVTRDEAAEIWERSRRKHGIAEGQEGLFERPNGTFVGTFDNEGVQERRFFGNREEGQRWIEEKKAAKAKSEKAVQDLLTRYKQRSKRARLVMLEAADPSIEAPFAWGSSGYAVGRNGVIVVNKAKFLENWGRTDAHLRDKLIDRIIDEEGFHANTTDEDALDYAQNMSSVEKAITERIYRGDPQRVNEPYKPGSMNLVDLGHEALRQRFQHLSRMSLREAFEGDLEERWTSRTLNAINQLIYKFRRFFGTKASARQESILNHVQRNIGIMERRLGGLPEKELIHRGADIPEGFGTKTPGMPRSEAELRGLQKVVERVRGGPEGPFAEGKGPESDPEPDAEKDPDAWDAWWERRQADPEFQKEYQRQAREMEVIGEAPVPKDDPEPDKAKGFFKWMEWKARQATRNVEHRDKMRAKRREELKQQERERREEEEETPFAEKPWTMRREHAHEQWEAKTGGLLRKLRDIGRKVRDGTATPEEKKWHENMKRVMKESEQKARAERPRTELEQEMDKIWDEQEPLWEKQRAGTATPEEIRHRQELMDKWHELAKQHEILPKPPRTYAEERKIQFLLEEITRDMEDDLGLPPSEEEPPPQGPEAKAKFTSKELEDATLGRIWYDRMHRGIDLLYGTFSDDLIKDTAVASATKAKWSDLVKRAEAEGASAFEKNLLKKLYRAGLEAGKRIRPLKLTEGEFKGLTAREGGATRDVKGMPTRIGPGLGPQAVPKLTSEDFENLMTVNRVLADLARVHGLLRQKTNIPSDILNDVINAEMSGESLEEIMDRANAAGATDAERGQINMFWVAARLAFRIGKNPLVRPFTKIGADLMNTEGETAGTRRIGPGLGPQARSKEDLQRDLEVAHQAQVRYSQLHAEGQQVKQQLPGLGSIVDDVLNKPRDVKLNEVRQYLDDNAVHPTIAGKVLKWASFVKLFGKQMDDPRLNPFRGKGRAILTTEGNPRMTGGPLELPDPTEKIVGGHLDLMDEVAREWKKWDSDGFTMMQMVPEAANIIDRIRNNPDYTLSDVREWIDQDQVQPQFRDLVLDYASAGKIIDTHLDDPRLRGLRPKINAMLRAEGGKAAGGRRIKQSLGPQAIGKFGPEELEDLLRARRWYESAQTRALRLKAQGVPVNVLIQAVASHVTGTKISELIEGAKAAGVKRKDQLEELRKIAMGMRLMAKHVTGKDYEFPFFQAITMGEGGPPQRGPLELGPNAMSKAELHDQDMNDARDVPHLEPVAFQRFFPEGIKRSDLRVFRNASPEDLDELRLLQDEARDQPDHPANQYYERGFQEARMHRAGQSLGAMRNEYPRELAARNGVLMGPGPFAIHKLYHGAREPYEKVDLRYVGTGEGHAAQGWGFYAAERPEVGTWYKPERIGHRHESLNINGKLVQQPNAPPNSDEGIDWFAKETIANQGYEEALNYARTHMTTGHPEQEEGWRRFEDAIQRNQGQDIKPLFDKGYLYEVDVAMDPSEVIDIDGRVDRTVVAKINRQLVKEGQLKLPNDVLGSYYDIIGKLDQRYPSLTQEGEGVSDFLNRAGFVAFKYADQFSRAGRYTFNVTNLGQEDTGKFYVTMTDQNGHTVAVTSLLPRKTAMERLKMMEEEDRKVGSNNYVIFREDRIQVVMRNGERINPSRMPDPRQMELGPMSAGKRKGKAPAGQQEFFIEGTPLPGQAPKEEKKDRPTAAEMGALPAQPEDVKLGKMAKVTQAELEGRLPTLAAGSRELATAEDMESILANYLEQAPLTREGRPRFDEWADWVRRRLRTPREGLMTQWIDAIWRYLVGSKRPREIPPISGEDLEQLVKTLELENKLGKPPKGVDVAKVGSIASVFDEAQAAEETAARMRDSMIAQAGRNEKRAAAMEQEAQAIRERVQSGTEEATQRAQHEREVEGLQQRLETVENALRKPDLADAERGRLENQAAEINRMLEGLQRRAQAGIIGDPFQRLGAETEWQSKLAKARRLRQQADDLMRQVHEGTLPPELPKRAPKVRDVAGEIAQLRRRAKSVKEYADEQAGDSSQLKQAYTLVDALNARADLLEKGVSPVSAKPTPGKGEQEDATVVARRYRNKAISEVARTLIEEAMPSPSLHPGEIFLDDIDFEADVAELPYHEFSDRDLASPRTIQSVFTEGARRHGRLVTETRRLAVLHDPKTGKTFLVDAVPEGRRGIQVMDPYGSDHIKLLDYLDRYKLVASILLKFRVKDFKYTYPSLRDYNEKLGIAAHKQMSNVKYQEFAGEKAKLEMVPEEEPEIEGTEGIVPKPMGAGPGREEAEALAGVGRGQTERTRRTPLTATELGATYDYLMSEMEEGVNTGDFMKAMKDMKYRILETRTRAERRIKPEKGRRELGKRIGGAGAITSEELRQQFAPGRPLKGTHRSMIAAVTKMAHRIYRDSGQAISLDESFDAALSEIYRTLQHGEFLPEDLRRDQFTQTLLGRFRERTAEIGGATRPEPGLAGRLMSPEAVETRLEQARERVGQFLPQEELGEALQQQRPELEGRPTPPRTESSARELNVLRGKVSLTGDVSVEHLANAIANLPLRHAETIIGQVLSGVPREAHAEVAQDASAIARRAKEGDLSGLRQSLSESREARATALRSLRRLAVAKAPSGLHPALRGRVALPEAPSKPPQPIPNNPDRLTAENAAWLAEKAAKDYPYTPTEPKVTADEPGDEAIRTFDFRPRGMPGPEARSKASDKARNALTLVWSSGHAWFLRRETVDLLAAFADSVDTKAALAGREAGGAVRSHTVNPKSLAAAKVVIASGGEAKRARQFLKLLDEGEAKANAMLTGPNTRRHPAARLWLEAIDKLREEVNYFLDNPHDQGMWDAAWQAGKEMRDAFRNETRFGIDIKWLPDYLPGRYEGEIFSDDAVMFWEQRVLGLNFTKPKMFPSYYHAIAEGPYVPVTYDISELVDHRVRQGAKRVNTELYLNSLKLMTDPASADVDPATGQPIQGTEKPIAMDALREIVATPAKPALGRPATQRLGRYYSPGPDYESLTLGPNHVPFYVRKGFHPLVEALTIRRGAFSRSPGGRLALNITSLLKHNWILILDTFHPGRLAQYYRAATGNPFEAAGGFGSTPSEFWRIEGVAALDFREADMDRAVQQGLITKKQADWAKEKLTLRTPMGTVAQLSRKEVLELLVTQGLNVGRIQDALYRKWMIPLVGQHFYRVNQIVFNKITRGLMANTAVEAFERYTREHPEIDMRRIARDVVKDTNILYGSLGRQGLIKNPTFREAAQLVFLAPQWVEALIQKEIRFVSRATGLSQYTGRKGLPRMGVLGRTMGRGLLFYLGLTQAINLLTKQQLTFQNKDGHQLDAWIPTPWNGKGSGFWLSPLSVFAEVAHDMVRMLHSDPNMVAAARHFVGNKFGPWGHLIMSFFNLGESPFGERPQTTGGILSSMAEQFPTPISLGRIGRAVGHAVAPGVVKPNPPGSLERQLISSLTGTKTEASRSYQQQIARRARDFMRDYGFEYRPYVMSPTEDASYDKIRRALNIGDTHGATRLLRRLQQVRTDDQIIKAFDRWSESPFTGNAALEPLFVNSLGKEGLTDYTNAVKERIAAYQQFIRLFANTPRKAPPGVRQSR